MLDKPAKENITVGCSNKCLEYRGRTVVFSPIWIFLSDGIRLSHTHTLSRTPPTSSLDYWAILHGWHFQIKELKISLFPKRISHGVFSSNWVWRDGFCFKALLWEALGMLVNQQTFECWVTWCFPIKHTERVYLFFDYANYLFIYLFIVIQSLIHQVKQVPVFSFVCFRWKVDFFLNVTLTGILKLVFWTLLTIL